MSEQTLQKFFLPFWQQLAMEVLSQRYVGCGSHIGLHPTKAPTWKRGASIKSLDLAEGMMAEFLSWATREGWTSMKTVLVHKSNLPHTDHQLFPTQDRLIKYAINFALRSQGQHPCVSLTLFWGDVLPRDYLGNDSTPSTCAGSWERRGSPDTPSSSSLLRVCGCLGRSAPPHGERLCVWTCPCCGRFCPRCAHLAVQRWVWRRA